MITIEFAQEGQALRLTSDSAPVQYADALPVQITVDADYASATELCLMTQPHKYLPSRTVLTLSNRTAAGKISRTALMQSGLVDFVLSGKIGDTILPTASCRVYVLPSVDPQSAQLAQDPETVTSIIDASVAKYLTEHPATTGATEKEAAQIAANTAALDTKLSTDGYSTGDLAKIPVVDKNGNLTVRNVHMLLEQADGEDALVLRGAVGQIIANIALSELREAIGSKEPEKISNGYWSGYKYPDGRAVLKWTLDVQNKALNSSNGVYVTNKLFDSTYRKYPDIFVEKPEFRATYVPSPNRVHVGAYATFQRGNSETSSGSGDKYFYKNPPDVYIVCGDNVNTTLLGELYMVAEGRWK